MSQNPKEEIFCDECDGRTTVRKGELVCIECGLVSPIKIFNGGSRRINSGTWDREQIRNSLHGFRGQEKW